MATRRDVLLGAAALLPLLGCGVSDAADTLRAEPYELGGVEARLLGVDVGVRVRYEGPATKHGFRVVLEGPDGEVVESREIGSAIDDEGVSLDHVAAVLVQGLPDDAVLLSARLAAAAGPGWLRTDHLIQDLMPADVGGFTLEQPRPQVARGTPAAVTVYARRFSNGGALRVELWVE